MDNGKYWTCDDCGQEIDACIRTCYDCDKKIKKVMNTPWYQLSVDEKLLLLKINLKHQLYNDNI